MSVQEGLEYRPSVKDHRRHEMVIMFCQEGLVLKAMSRLTLKLWAEVQVAVLMVVVC